LSDVALLAIAAGDVANSAATDATIGNGVWRMLASIGARRPTTPSTCTRGWCSDPGLLVPSLHGISRARAVPVTAPPLPKMSPPAIYIANAAKVRP